VRGTALVSLALLIPFTAAVVHRALVLKSALLISAYLVQFDCGCGTGEEFICRKLLENARLIALSVGLLGGSGLRCGRYGRPGQEKWLRSPGLTWCNHIILMVFWPR